MRHLITIMLICLLTGCSSYSLVNSKVYNHDDLCNHTTFRIVSLKMGKLPPGMQQSTYIEIAEAVRHEMTLRGYQESSRSPLLINIAVTVNDTGGGGDCNDPGPYYSTTYPCYIYPRELYTINQSAPPEIEHKIYNEGVLTIDVVNMTEKATLYSSSVATILDEEGNYRDGAAIDEAVGKLFCKFPAKPTKALAQQL